MPRIFTIVGARPQFIKASEISRVLRHSPVEEHIVHTGQHYDSRLSDIFFKELGIPHPLYNLGVGSGHHGAQTGRMVEKLEGVFLKDKPDGVIVYGDTNTTVSGALAAAKLHIPVFHVEAGLRSYNRRMPEEINRVLTDHMSDLLFCPSRTAVDNLEKEGIPGSRVVFSGDVMYDSFLRTASALQDDDRPGFVPEESYSLVTIHRAENTDDRERLIAIADSLVQLSHSIKVVFVLHPRTCAALEEERYLDRLGQFVSCVEPVSYFQMIAAQKHASLVITDSGGLQKEAYFLKRPCLVVREEAEWVELFEDGSSKLVSPFNLASEAQAHAQSKHVFRTGIYGDGNAADLICKEIQNYFL